MVLRRTEPLAPKRKLEDILPVSFPPKQAPKKRRVQASAVSDNDDDSNDACSDKSSLSQHRAAAIALFQLKKSPIAQWAKLFDEEESSSDEGDNEEGSHPEEHEMVTVLTQAAFAPPAQKLSPALLQIVGRKVKPDDFLQCLLASVGKTTKLHRFDALDNYFASVSTSGYTVELVKAVRNDDVATCQRLHAAGTNMLCGSQFGDSILHLACRCNSVRVVHFLLRSCHVTPRLVCDYGRTPLHDACWTSTPNFVLWGMLLDACPDLLYVTDRRGFTPLQYVPPARHAVVCRFLAAWGAHRLRSQ